MVEKTDKGMAESIEKETWITSEKKALNGYTTVYYPGSLRTSWFFVSITFPVIIDTLLVRIIIFIRFLSIIAINFILYIEET